MNGCCRCATGSFRNSANDDRRAGDYYRRICRCNDRHLGHDDVRLGDYYAVNVDSVICSFDGSPRFCFPFRLSHWTFLCENQVRETHPVGCASEAVSPVVMTS